MARNRLLQFVIAVLILFIVGPIYWVTFKELWGWFEQSNFSIISVIFIVGVIIFSRWITRIQSDIDDSELGYPPPLEVIRRAVSIEWIGLVWRLVLLILLTVASSMYAPPLPPILTGLPPLIFITIVIWLLIELLISRQSDQIQLTIEILLLGLFGIALLNLLTAPGNLARITAYVNCVRDPAGCMQGLVARSYTNLESDQDVTVRVLFNTGFTLLIAVVLVLSRIWSIVVIWADSNPDEAPSFPEQLKQIIIPASNGTLTDSGPNISSLRRLRSRLNARILLRWIRYVVFLIILLPPMLVILDGLLVTVVPLLGQFGVVGASEPHVHSAEILAILTMAGLYAETLFILIIDRIYPILIRDANKA